MRCEPWIPGPCDGANRARTGDLLGAIQALSQLSYSPASGHMDGRSQTSVVPRARRAGARRADGRGVWFSGAMGLLDDAIREHLELKRRRGADAGEVAREEHEVLDTLSGSPGEHFPEDPGLE